MNAFQEYIEVFLNTNFKMSYVNQVLALYWNIFKDILHVFINIIMSCIIVSINIWALTPTALVLLVAEVS